MCLGLISFTANAETTGPMQIGPVLRYAMEHAPALTSAKANVSGAEAQKLAAVAAFLPSFTLTDQPQVFHPFSSTGSSVVGGIVVPADHSFNANVASANLNLNLYDGGKDSANYNAALASLRSASLGLTAAMDALFQQILADFVAAGSDQLTVESQERSLGIDEELVDLTQKRMRGQVASGIDLIKAQQQVLQAQAQLSQARQQRTADLEKLDADLGLAQTGVALPPQPWLPRAPQADSAGISIGNDPAVQAAQAAVVAAQRKVDAARAEYYPTVALTGQYNLLGLSSSSMADALDSTGKSNYSVGLLVTVPLLPHLNAEADVDQALANVDGAQGQYQGALAAAANLVADATTRLAESRKTLEIATRSAALAHHNVRLVQDSYAAHQADQLDVDNAKLLAEQADLSLQTAQLSCRLVGWEMVRAAHPRQFPTLLLSAVLAGPDPDGAAVDPSVAQSK